MYTEISKNDKNFNEVGMLSNPKPTLNAFLGFYPHLFHV